MNTTDYEKILLDKLKNEARCPICALVQEEEFTLISKLQYDVTNDERLRKEFPAQGTFCDFHFRQFRKVANNETNALLLISFIEHFRANGMEAHGDCSVCLKLNDYEGALTTAMASLLKNESYRTAYAASNGVCFHHEEDVGKASGSAEIIHWLSEMQQQQLQREIPPLQHLANASYYNTTAYERGAIVRVVEKIVGRKSVGL
jgi:hypothetical protein